MLLRICSVCGRHFCPLARLENGVFMFVLRSSGDDATLRVNYVKYMAIDGNGKLKLGMVALRITN